MVVCCLINLTARLTYAPSIFQLYRVGQFYWRKNPECPVKTTDLSQITDKRDQILSNVVTSTSRHEQNSNSQR
jgi:hypothetical protein